MTTIKDTRSKWCKLFHKRIYVVGEAKFFADDAGTQLIKTTDIKYCPKCDTYWIGKQGVGVET